MIDEEEVYKRIRDDLQKRFPPVGSPADFSVESIIDNIARLTIRLLIEKKIIGKTWREMEK